MCDNIYVTYMYVYVRVFLCVCACVWMYGCMYETPQIENERDKVNKKLAELSRTLDAAQQVCKCQ